MKLHRGAVETIEGSASSARAFPDTRTILGHFQRSFGLPAGAREVVNPSFSTTAPKPDSTSPSSTPKNSSAFASIPKTSAASPKIFFSRSARGTSRRPPRARFSATSR